MRFDIFYKNDFVSILKHLKVWQFVYFSGGQAWMCVWWLCMYLALLACSHAGLPKKKKTDSLAIILKSSLSSQWSFAQCLKRGLVLVFSNFRLLRRTSHWQLIQNKPHTKLWRLERLDFSLIADLLHLFLITKLTEASKSHRKMIQNSALRLLYNC